METPSTKTLFSLLAPFLAGTVIVAVFLMVVLLRVIGTGSASVTVDAVTFDVVKFSNAQRAVASAFIKQGADVAQANDLLLGLSERTRLTIAEVAGPGTLVLVKQTVVQGVQRDITDDVLAKLGLPQQVPTQDGAEFVLDSAPTMLLHSFENQLKQTSDPVRFKTDGELLP